MGLPPTTSSAERSHRQVMAGLAANVLLAGGKLIAGVVGHSYALIADAVESLADMLGSVVILGGLHIGAREPDKDHPYGHGKAEALAATIVALMVLIAGAGVLVKSFDSFRERAAPPASWTLGVLIVVVLVKGALYLRGRRLARATGSAALGVDASHHLSDAVSSLAALTGVALAVLKGWTWADGAAGLVGGALIVVNGAMLLRAPVHELMDKEPHGVPGDAASAAAEVPGVRRVQKALVRQSGPWLWIDMHVWVDPDMSVRDSHRLAHAVKDAVRARMPRVRDVLVHVEPDAAARPAPDA